MDYVSEIFNLYEPDICLQWMNDAWEQINSTDVLVDFLIGTVTCGGFIIGYYKYRRARQIKAESPSRVNCAEEIRSDNAVQEGSDIGRLSGYKMFPKNLLHSLTDDNALLTDDSSSSSWSSIAQSDDNTEAQHLDISMPAKDVSDSKEASDATSATGDSAVKVIYKKILQDGVNARLKLLLAEKKLFAQMKKMQSLKKSLLESSPYNSAYDGLLNKTSIAISKRKTFFDSNVTDKTFLNRSSTPGTNSDATEDAAKVKLINLKKNISQLINVHLHELSLLHENIAEKQMQTKKLEIMKREIDSLNEIIEKENNKDKESANEPNNNIVYLYDETTNTNTFKKEEDRKSSRNKNLTAKQLQSINTLKHLFINYDNEQELSTIMEKSHEDEENSFKLINDMSTLESDPKSIKKSWSRSSTPRKSPGVQTATST